MKNKLLVALTIIICLVLSLTALTACGKKVTDEYNGTYYYFNGTDCEEDSFVKINGDELVFESATFMLTFDGNKFTATCDEYTVTGTINGDKLVLAFDGDEGTYILNGFEDSHVGGGDKDDDNDDTTKPSKPAVPTASELKGALATLSSAENYKTYRSGSCNFKFGGSSSSGNGSFTAYVEEDIVYTTSGDKTYYFRNDDGSFCYTEQGYSDATWAKDEYMHADSVNDRIDMLNASKGMSNYSLLSFSQFIAHLSENADTLLTYSSEFGELSLAEPMQFDCDTVKDGKAELTVSSFGYTFEDGEHVITCKVEENCTMTGGTSTGSFNGTVRFTNVGEVEIVLPDEITNIMTFDSVSEKLNELNNGLREINDSSFTANGKAKLVDDKGATVLENTYDTKVAVGSMDFCGYSKQNDNEVYACNSMFEIMAMVNGANVEDTDCWPGLSDDYDFYNDASEIARNMQQNFGAATYLPTNTVLALRGILNNWERFAVEGKLECVNGEVRLVSGQSIVEQFVDADWGDNVDLNVTQFSLKFTDNGFVFELTSVAKFVAPGSYTAVDYVVTISGTVSLYDPYDNGAPEVIWPGVS